LATGRNTVWCASLLAAWKALQDEVSGGTVQLDGAADLSDSLNAHRDPRLDIPQDSIYAAAGRVEEGIVARIREDLGGRFPEAPAPEFLGVDPKGLVVYAKLQANVRFRMPYHQNSRPLCFRDSGGVVSEVKSFGLPTESRDFCLDLRLSQPRVVFVQSADDALPWYLVDLDRTSEPNQVLVAYIERKETLRAAVAAVQEALQEGDPHSVVMADTPLSPTDVLLVPEVVLKVGKRFEELEGRTLVNPSFAGVRLDVVRQDVEFTFDRSGAALRSDALMMTLGLARDLIFDRPFLIVMRTRAAEQPYFAMWVDNAQFLVPFES
ncbi:MAG: hypothetical protein R3178_06835, partial [Rhodothermales bacterium]|nr:hypothetical protein [Rhodothermales bacterium]